MTLSSLLDLLQCAARFLNSNAPEGRKASGVKNKTPRGKHFFLFSLKISHNQNRQNSLNANIDIETTGGNHQRDKITEIAVYVHDGTKVIDEFTTLINPERSIPYYIYPNDGDKRCNGS